MMNELEVILERVDMSIDKISCYVDHSLHDGSEEEISFTEGAILVCDELLAVRELLCGMIKSKAIHDVQVARRIVSGNQKSLL